MYSKTSSQGGIMVTFQWFFTKSARKSTEFWKNNQIHGHFFLFIIGKGARREPPQAPPERRREGAGALNLPSHE